MYRAERRVTDSETLGEKSSLFFERRYASSATPPLGCADIVVASETFARIIIMCDSIVVFFHPQFYWCVAGVRRASNHHFPQRLALEK